MKTSMNERKRFESLVTMKENYEYKRNIMEGGLAHVHTEASGDAVFELDEIGEYVREKLRSEYFIISDHLTSPYKVQKYSEFEVRGKINGMLEQVKQYNESYERPKCISGVEANVVAGGVDVPDTLLEKIDFVTASRHSPWGNEDSATIEKNLIAAIENPNVDAVGHINRYIDVPVDWDRIFGKAEETNTFIEINFDTPPSQEVLQVMSKYKIFYVLGLDFHTFCGFKLRPPLDSEVITGLTDLKTVERSDTAEGTKIRQEYLKELPGFNVLKKLVELMRQLEASGIDTDRIVNSLKLADFFKLIKKPKNLRTL